MRGAPNFSGQSLRFVSKKIGTPTHRFAAASQSLTHPDTAIPEEASSMRFYRRLTMNALATISTIPSFNALAFDDAVMNATRRAYHSFFDQHVIEEDDGGYITIDEGDYGALPMHMIDRIVHTVPGMMGDEFDADSDDELAAAASFMSAGIDTDFDANDVPF
jgi:hypothetical protein